MAFNYTAYTNNSDNNVLRKSLTNLGSGKCELKGDSSILSPVFNVSNLPVTTAARLNYIYIPEWKRYYYVTDLIAKRGHAFEIVCESDPLMTFASNISGLQATIRRQENEYNDYIPDSEVYARATRHVVQKKIGSLGTGAFYVTVNH